MKIFFCLLSLYFCEEFQKPLIRYQKISSNQLLISLENSNDSTVKFIKNYTEIDANGTSQISYQGQSNFLNVTLNDYPTNAVANFQNCKIPLFFIKSFKIDEPSLILLDDEKILINADYWGYKELESLENDQEFLMTNILNSDFLTQLSSQSIQIKPYDMLEELDANFLCLLMEEEFIFDFQQIKTKISDVITFDFSPSLNIDQIKKRMTLEVESESVLVLKVINYLDVVKFETPFLTNDIQQIRFSYLQSGKIYDENFLNVNTEFIDIEQLLVFLSNDSTEAWKLNAFLETQEDEMINKRDDEEIVSSSKLKLILTILGCILGTLTVFGFGTYLYINRKKLKMEERSQTINTGDQTDLQSHSNSLSMRDHRRINRLLNMNLNRMTIQNNDETQLNQTSLSSYENQVLSPHVQLRQPNIVHAPDVPPHTNVFSFEEDMEFSNEQSNYDFDNQI